jgi:hypothetical protein
MEGPLEDLLPHVFTWVVEPKQSSFAAVKAIRFKIHKKHILFHIKFCTL